MADQHSLDLDKLEGRAALARIGLWAFIALSLVEMWCVWMESSGRVDLENGEDMLTAAVGLGYVVYLVVFIATVTFVAMWFHRAHANLFASGVDGLEYTPGWAVGWYFVPFANLFKPFQAMRELWNASFGAGALFQERTPAEVRWWWAAWVAGNILSSIATRLTSNDQMEIGFLFDAASTVLLVAAGWLLMTIIREITAIQRGGSIAAHAFA